MNRFFILSAAQKAGISAVVATTMLLASFLLLEPTVGRTQTSDTSGPFRINQTIGAEISFIVDAQEVTMNGSINGLTGGNATGTAYAVVQTNNTNGYTMSIAFSTSGPAMRGRSTDNRGIRDYYEANATAPSASSSQPDLTFVASTSAQLAFTVNSSSTVALNFRNNGAVCGAGAADDPLRCWKGPSVDGITIVDEGSAAPTGATTTFVFKVNVPSGPVPTLESDTYTATATLTAINK